MSFTLGDYVYSPEVVKKRPSEDLPLGR